jgi:hypothetical protein|tara:strand:- start:13964 stop:14251 length:288 start_codon:yes stop_codon:yes gene_type:complete
MNLRLRLVATLGITLTLLWGITAAWSMRDLSTQLEHSLASVWRNRREWWLVCWIACLQRLGTVKKMERQLFPHSMVLLVGYRHFVAKWWRVRTLR